MQEVRCDSLKTHKTSFNILKNSSYLENNNYDDLDSRSNSVPARGTFEDFADFVRLLQAWKMGQNGTFGKIGFLMENVGVKAVIYNKSHGCRHSNVFYLTSTSAPEAHTDMCELRKCYLDRPDSYFFFFPLTSIAHGGEDVLRHVHDGVRGLVVASDGLAAAGVVADVLQQVAERLAHHASRRPHLLEQLAVIAGRAARLHAGLHRAVHQLPGLDELLLTHRGADGRAYHLRRRETWAESQAGRRRRTAFNKV